LDIMNTRQPSFATARLALRPAGGEDLVALHGLWSDAQVRRFLFDDQAVSLELAQSILEDCLVHAPQGLGLWLVYPAAGSTPLGCVGLNLVTVAADYEPVLSGLLEPLAAFAPGHWHQGYAQESVRPLLDYAFGPLDQSTLAAVNDVPNSASAKMLLCLGFRPLSEVQGPRYRMRTYRLGREDRRQRNTADHEMPSA
jgi:RimJ/RimL family protein N-acetyltransferase